MEIARNLTQLVNLTACWQIRPIALTFIIVPRPSVEKSIPTTVPVWTHLQAVNETELSMLISSSAV